jgi:hypothetical protein
MRRETAKWVRKGEDDLMCAQTTKPRFHDQISQLSG